MINKLINTKLEKLTWINIISNAVIKELRN